MTNKLLEHFKRMQDCAARYVLPNDNAYIDRDGKDSTATQEHLKQHYRDWLFANDMLYLLDCPEQREAEAAVGNTYIATINDLCADIHADNIKAGWWTDMHTGESILETRNVPEILMLIVSEVAEAMEGYRKDLMDDKLPHRKMMEVELADAVIRIADLCGAKGYDLGGAIAEKRAYNANREDHKLENRIKPGGKAF